MITIQNETGEILVVHNSFFSMDIPIGKTVEISSEQLCGDFTIFCRFFGSFDEEQSEDYGFKRSTIRKRWYAYYEHISTFPLATQFTVKDGQTLKLKKQTDDKLFYLLFKIARLKKIIRETGQEEKHLFYTTDSKRRFRRLMRFSLLFLPIAIILAICGIWLLFQKEYDWMEKLMGTGFSLAIALVIFWDVYTYFSTRKWDCLVNE